MKLKSSLVNLDALHTTLRGVLPFVETVYSSSLRKHYRRRDREYQITITATCNGNHKLGSLHFTKPCRAVDFRAHDIPRALAFEIVKILEDVLGQDYEIIAHGKGPNFHFHLAYVNMHDFGEAVA